MSRLSDEPCLTPPFAVLYFCDGKSTVIDREGRQLLYEQRNNYFVTALAEVMNENRERLVKAWKRGMETA